MQTIVIDAVVRNGNFVLSITNPVAENVIIGKNNTLKTTKKNTNEHGIGTKNIQKIVNKYNGTLILECQNKTFHLGVILNLKNG